MNLPPLQPLRILPHWTVDWNTLFELDPTEENVRAGFFGASVLFGATSTLFRSSMILEWWPKDDPTGRYHLTLYYVQWERNERGRRRKNVALDFHNAKVVYEYDTPSRTEAVAMIESVFRDCSKYQEQN